MTAFHGTRTVHKSEAAWIVRASAGEFVTCTVDVRGAVADFKFVCEHHDVFVPAPLTLSRYQWRTLHIRPDGRNAADVHTVQLNFTGAKFYRYRMELFAAGGTLLETLKDIEYGSEDPTDVFLEPIRLRIE
jgi:hypothetical protein